MSTVLTAEPAAPAPAAAAANESIPAPTPAAPPAATADAPALPEWLTDLPDDLKAEKGWERFKDKAALARSYRDLEKKIGTTPKAPALDVPADPSLYDLKLPPGEFPVNEAKLSHYKGFAHKHGLSQAQAQANLEFYAEHMAERVAEEHKGWVEQQKDLAKEWGQPLFAKRVSLASEVLREFDGEGTFRAWLNASKLGDHPMMIRMLAAFGEQFAEDGVIAPAAQHGMTEEDVHRRIAELRAEIVSGKHPEGSPEYERLVQARSDLYRMLPGGKTPVATLGGR